MDFYIGQVFEVMYPQEVAQWCMENNAYVAEIDSINDNRMFEIKAIPEPTEYEKAQARIAELKELLAGTDYVVLKIAEGVATREDYASVLDIRQTWREEINELELVVDNQAVSD
jgi:hypothetical protein